jgi:hypothetical protein
VERQFITDTILDYNESRRVIHDASEKTGDRCDIGGFVSADDVVKWLRRLQWRPKDLVALAFVFDYSCIAISNTMVDSYLVLAMIGAVYVQALCGFVVSRNLPCEPRSTYFRLDCLIVRSRDNTELDILRST